MWRTLCLAGILIFAAAGCETPRSASRRHVAVHAPESPLKIRLAVVPVEGGGNLQAGLTELLTSELLKANRFIVLERGSLTEVQAEQARGADPGFWNEGGVSSRIIPARLLLSIKALSVGSEEDALIGTLTEGRGGGFRIRRAKAMLEVKLLDVATAQVIASRVVEASATGGDLAAGVRTGSTLVGTAMFNSSAVGRASKEAIKKSVNFVLEKFSAIPWETRVAGVREDGKVYIAAGAEDGLHLGLQLGLYRPGEAVIDPTSGVQLAVTEARIGLVRVEDLKDQYAVGAAISDTVPKRGDILRPATR